jgi:hypothetical protein
LLHDVLDVLLLLRGGCGSGSYLLALLVHLHRPACPSYVPSPVHPVYPLRQKVLQCLVFLVKDVQVMIGVLSCLLPVVGFPLRVHLRGLQFLGHHYCLRPAAGSIA